MSRLRWARATFGSSWPPPRVPRRSDHYLETVASQMHTTRADAPIGEQPSLLPAVERAVLTGAPAEDLAQSLREGLRTGVEGRLEDDLGLRNPRGLGLDEIERPSSSGRGPRI